MGFTVDFSEAPERKEVRDGQYVVVVDNAETGVSGGGNAKLDLQMKIVEALNTDNEEFVGQFLWDHPVLEGPGAWKMRPICRAFLGTVPTADDELSTEDFIGEQAIVTVVGEVWAEEKGGDGKKRAKVQKYEPVVTSGLY
jgi:hypothetical protein